MSIQELDLSEETPGIPAIEDIEEDDDDIEETIGERLMGLTEMFPEKFRSACGSMSVMSVKGVKVGYGLSCNVIWAAVSAFAILAMPFLLEQERSGILEQQKEQERQLLLGPSSAMSGSGMMPPLTAARPS